MKKVLAIDYGASKTGMAVGDTETKLVDPLVVVRHKSIGEAITKIVKTAKMEDVAMLVLGLSGGVNDADTKKLGKELDEKLGVEIIYWDEKFSTSFAQDKSIEAGHGPKKRKEMEDAYAAAVILESYFESLD